VLALLASVGGLTAANVADNSLSAASAFSVGSGGQRPDVTIAVDNTTPAMLDGISHAANVAGGRPDESRRLGLAARDHGPAGLTAIP
jgi:hypothetical protein